MFVHDRLTGETTRVSVASDGSEGDDQSGFFSSISADGRYVAFQSRASNLVDGDTNGSDDVFVHDRDTGETTRVSAATDGTQANGSSMLPSVSADGRYVAFESNATNLVDGDTNAAWDVFVHDRDTGQTTRVSVTSDSGEGNGESGFPSISADGRCVAFYSFADNLVDGDTNGFEDVFVHDRDTGQTTRVSVDSDGTQGNGHSDMRSISGDGRYVAFDSGASNLVNGDTNGSWDIFVHDRDTGQTTRVSVASDGTQADSHSDSPSISGDGRYVAFRSDATSLVPGDPDGYHDIFVHDRQTGETTCVSVPNEGHGPSEQAAISGDGRYVGFQSDASNLVDGDTNGLGDIFVHDRWTRENSLVSIATGGAQANMASRHCSVSGDGRYVAFDCQASNLVSGDNNWAYDVFVHDRETGETTRVSVASDGSQADSHSSDASISADGRYVAFGSWASNLVDDDTNGYKDVFVHDRQTGETTRVSVASDGSEGDQDSYYPSISADGRYVAFESLATNLVDDDTNGRTDVFVHDRVTGETARVSVASDGTQGNHNSDNSSISADGRYVAFRSWANSLVVGDSNTYADIFVRDRETGETTRISVTSDGSQGNHDSHYPSISADGRYVAFESYASNLVDEDTNGHTDVFVRDRETGETTRVSVASDGTEGNGESVGASISGDGRCVAFESDADNLVSGDTNGLSDVFVHARWSAAVCCFTYDPTAPDDQTPVQFTDCSTHPYAQVVAWEWDFGDGGTSTAQNPSHEFAAGTYLVSLTVSDNYGGATSCEQQIVVLPSTVEVSIPLAEAGWHMISLPLEPVNKNILLERPTLDVIDEGSIFYQSYLAGNDPRNRLFRFQPGVGYWTYEPSLYPDQDWYEIGVEPAAGKPHPGPWCQGFWFLVDEPHTLTYIAHAMPPTVQTRFMDVTGAPSDWAWMMTGACARVPEPYDPDVSTWPTTCMATDMIWGKSAPPAEPAEWWPTAACPVAADNDAWDRGYIGLALSGYWTNIGYYTVSPNQIDYCGTPATTENLTPGEGYWLDIEDLEVWLKLGADQSP